MAIIQRKKLPQGSKYEKTTIIKYGVPRIEIQQWLRRVEDKGFGQEWSMGNGYTARG
jgi:hypothetical protein